MNNTTEQAIAKNAGGNSGERSAFLNDGKRLRFFVVYAAVVTFAFISPLFDAVQFAWKAQFYSHTLMVPIICAYLIREKRDALVAPARSSAVPAIGFALLGAAAMAFLYSGLRPMFLSDHYALIVFSYLSFLMAGAFLFFGAQKLRPIAFPLAFFAFAIPMPFSLLDAIQVQLQHASAEAAYWMMGLINIPMLRDGVDFKLPGMSIRVAEECSGFNSTFVLFMVSLLAGYLFLKSPARKTVLALAVIPLAILRNGIRITTIAGLCVYKDPKMIHSAIHQHGGPLFFALSMVPFLALLWYLRRSEIKAHSNI